MWSEIFDEIKKLNKHELSLNQNKLIALLESNDGKVDSALFALKQLNFLQLSNSHALKDPINSWDELCNLQQLHLFGNKLTTLPGLENLIHLKVLDVSDNLLSEINFDLTKATHLTTVNLSNNQITSCVIKSASIHILNLSINKLEDFPELPTCTADLNLSKNQIKAVPDAINEQLPHLKVLDLSNNKITAVPKTLSAIKFKTLNLKDNPLKDKKLNKFVDQNQSMKAIMDHIQKLGISSPPKAQNDEENKNETKQEAESKAKLIQIKKFDEDFRVEYSLSVKDVRGFILCCIVNDLEFNAASFKEFLQFQTKLHDTICKKREMATIATHDLDLIASSKHIRYIAKHKDEIKIQPLKAVKTVTGSEYFETLKKEAETIRKEKKRSHVTGVYKFLDLLKDKDHFAFLETADTNICLSLPPLTNSEASKMSLSTKRMLIEITSHLNAAICNKIMTEMIQMLLHMNESLNLQQVRILYTDGTLKTLFPSKVDLKELESESIKVLHP